MARARTAATTPLVRVNFARGAARAALATRASPNANLPPALADALPQPCPAARLPPPPPAGGAWEKDETGRMHVLWDETERRWADAPR